jgi:hypothetical protein
LREYRFSDIVPVTSETSRTFSRSVEARQKTNRSLMSNENLAQFSETQEEDLAEGEKILFRAHSIRVSAKDILLDAAAAPASFPNREKLTALANEILALVPVYRPSLEEADDRGRNAN